MKIETFLIKIAGAISSAIATPTDVLKVRMQVHGRGTDKIGLLGCFREVYKNEGVSGLWKGVSPTAQRGNSTHFSPIFGLKLSWIFSAAIIAAVELPVYDFCKIHLLETFGDHVANHFM